MPKIKIRGRGRPPKKKQRSIIPPTENNFIKSFGTLEEMQAAINQEIENKNGSQIAESKSHIFFDAGQWHVVLVFLFKGLRARKEWFDYSENPENYDYKKLFDNAGWACSVMAEGKLYYFGTIAYSKRPQPEPMPV